MTVPSPDDEDQDADEIFVKTQKVHPTKMISSTVSLELDKSVKYYPLKKALLKSSNSALKK